MVTTSNWGPNKTFKLIPVSKDCPYGDPMKMKLTRTAEGGDVKKERRLLKTYAEFYITEKSEIETFINGFCVNADSYDYAAFLDADAIPQPDPRALPAEKATNMNLNLV